jgi:FkbM family methyltransferase
MLDSTAQALFPKEWLRIIRDYLLRRMNLRYHSDTGVTVRVNSFSDWIIYNDIFVRGEYDVALRDWLSDVSQSARLVILDLGANVGFFLYRLLDLMIRQKRENDFFVTLVEADPSIYKDLCERIGSDEFLKGKVHPAFGLVGKRHGTGRFFQNALQAKNSIFSSSQKQGKEIPYQDIDQLMHDYGRIDLLKCDIEGAEEFFFTNYPGLLSKVDSLIVELHHDVCDTAACIRLIEDAGLQEKHMLRKLPDSTVSYYSRKIGPVIQD